MYLGVLCQSMLDPGLSGFNSTLMCVVVHVGSTVIQIR